MGEGHTDLLCAHRGDEDFSPVGGRRGSGSQQFRCAGQAHGVIQNPAIRVVAQLACLEELANRSFSFGADPTEVVIVQRLAGMGVN